MKIVEELKLVQNLIDSNDESIILFFKKIKKKRSNKIKFTCPDSI